MFASQSDLTQRHLIFLFQPLGHMGWSVRQCWLMNRSYSHSIQLVYNIIRNGSTWQKNRGLPLIFLLHPNILYATYATIYIHVYILPSNPNISHCLNHFGQISPFLHIPQTIPSNFWWLNLYCPPNLNPFFWHCRHTCLFKTSCWSTPTLFWFMQFWLAFLKK